jgi:hypothetical protein
MSQILRIAKVVSGGQSGADRGGLSAAIAAGVPHGGWCPKGRRAEDGVIPTEFELEEMATASYLARTEANVVDSHATVVFAVGAPSGGSRKTIEFARKHGRPCLSVDVGAISDLEAAEKLSVWLDSLVQSGAIPMAQADRIVLNVAGSRESKSRGIQERVARVLRLVLRKAESARAESRPADDSDAPERGRLPPRPAGA